MNAQPWHVSVLVRASKEEKMLPQCLRAIKSAALFLSRLATVDIVLAVDESAERTQALGELLLAGRGVVVCTDAELGQRARSLAARVALERYAGPLDRCWLAYMDAGTCVPITWLRDQIGLAQRGVEAIAGTISPISQGGGEHEAHLGVRADIYLKTGGWMPVAAGNCDLWSRLREIGAKRVSLNHASAARLANAAGAAS
jgi:hypothetical protein